MYYIYLVKSFLHAGFWVYVLPLLNILALVYVQPFVVYYYLFKFPYDVLYILGTFGMSIWFILPAFIFALPLAWFNRKRNGFKERFKYYSQRFFIGFNLLILAFNSLLVFSKSVLHHEPFPKMLYAQITDKAADCGDLHQGKFKWLNYTLYRDSSQQVEISGDLKDTVSYSISWLSDHEYRLIRIKEHHALMDTIDVKVSNNDSAYYDCFRRVGIYAQYYRIYKLK